MIVEGHGRQALVIELFVTGELGIIRCLKTYKMPLLIDMRTVKVTAFFDVQELLDNFAGMRYYMARLLMASLLMKTDVRCEFLPHKGGINFENRTLTWHT